VNAKSEIIGEPAAESPAFDFDAVFTSQYCRIAKVIAKVVRDPARAEDLVVEVFWKLWRKPKAHGPNAAAWLHRAALRVAILRNEVLSYQEIAHVLELNAASVGTFLGRAQQAFRKEYIRRYGQQ
jgi:RNA polymerase sigma-70 factor (ECF subfamily)